MVSYRSAAMHKSARSEVLRSHREYRSRDQADELPDTVNALRSGGKLPDPAEDHDRDGLLMAMMSHASQHGVDDGPKSILLVSENDYIFITQRSLHFIYDSHHHGSTNPYIFCPLWGWRLLRTSTLRTSKPFSPNKDRGSRIRYGYRYVGSNSFALARAIIAGIREEVALAFTQEREGMSMAMSWRACRSPERGRGAFGGVTVRGRRWRYRDRRCRWCSVYRQRIGSYEILTRTFHCVIRRCGPQ
nr:hypothetical protein CFP56_34689 [Quercus suber]